MDTTNTSSAMPKARHRTFAAIAAALTLGLVLAPGLTQTASAAPQTAATTAPGIAASTATSSVAHQKIVKKKATVKVKANKKSYIKGKKGAKLSVRVTAAGKNATGKVKFIDGKKKLRTVKLRKGRAAYTLPKNLKAKKHTITVRFTPTGTAKKTVKSASAKIRVTVLDRGKVIAKTAKKYVGVKYRHGGKTPKGFDCSGFTSYVYKKAGIKKLPSSSSAQRHAGKVVSRSKAKVGDLIWTPGHVAIYLGGNKQIDAPRPGKTIQVRSIWQSNPTFIRV